jgi:putative protein-disulfide isomerase
MTVQLLYFANPMCSWCWGFAPSIGALAERFGASLEVTVLLGSLGRGDRPMREADKAFTREHWEHVRAASGQPFDFAFFDRDGFVYDTARPARAVMAVRDARPNMALPFFHAVQRAFYASNRDVTDDRVLLDIAGELGLADGFGERLADADLLPRVQAEMMETARLGVSGYPTLVGLAAGRAFPVTVGWRSPDDLLQLVSPVVAAAERLEASAGS